MKTDLEILEIAMTCHEVNRVYCAGHGDHSQPRWDMAPDWQQNSAINGVKFHLENPHSQPYDSHVSWMNEKLDQGWKYGEVKDPDKKEHPCIVPFTELPKMQQAKDMLFLTVVRSFE